MRKYLVLAALILAGCDNTAAIERAERARQVEERCMCLEIEEGLVRARFDGPTNAGACRADRADYQSIMDEADELGCRNVQRWNHGQRSCEFNVEPEEEIGEEFVE